MEIIPWALREEPGSIVKRKGWQIAPPKIDQMHPTVSPKPTQLIKLAGCLLLLKDSEG